jgi:hypothetical protein
MATNPEHLADLKRIQEAVASLDPSIMELDPSNEDDAWAITLTGALFSAMKDGGSLTVTTKGEDGHTETIDIQSMGTDLGSEPVAAVSIGSSDGTLTPRLAGLAAELMGESHQDEVSRLVGE